MKKGILFCKQITKNANNLTLTSDLIVVLLPEFEWYNDRALCFLFKALKPSFIWNSKQNISDAVKLHMIMGILIFNSNTELGKLLKTYIIFILCHFHLLLYLFHYRVIIHFKIEC